MQAFIQKLKQRYDQRRQQVTLDADGMQQLQRRLNALRLADAALAKLALNSTEPSHIPHIGILGPTQAGKSTLVNLLCERELAGVSPLAGYTVHAQGFATGVDAQHDVLAAAQALFPDFALVEQNSLQPDELETYSLQFHDSTNPVARVLWDSPDFDSVESRGYRTAVLRVAALADVLILMTSKDKYADKSVWDMLSLVLPLQKPLLVCINKLSAEDSAVVSGSFLQRFRDTHAEYPTPNLLSLPYIKGMDTAAGMLPEETRSRAQSAVSDALEQIDRNAEKRHTYELIRLHWNDWLEPVHIELAANSHWITEVDSAIEAAMDHYRAGFLEHPGKYDTFNRALAELLTLLEVPGLAGALGTTRKLVTWPVRKLFNLGRSVIDQEHDRLEAVTDLEKEVLQQVLQQLIGQLGSTALDQTEQEQADALWWKAVFRKIRDSETELENRFSGEVELYQEDFAPQIEIAARELYSTLQKQPALLNTLRAARVSTDAAAVVLAVKSGGLAATDLVLAPAMLSLTTMLTEGALGKYMDTVKSSLQRQQQDRVHELLTGPVRTQLLALAGQLEDEALMRIDADELTIAEDQLDASLATH